MFCHSAGSVLCVSCVFQSAVSSLRRACSWQRHVLLTTATGFLHNNAWQRAGGCAGDCHTAAAACTAAVQLSKLLAALGQASWTGDDVVHIAKRRGLQSILQLSCMKVAAAFVRVASRGKIPQLSCNGVFGTVAVQTDLASALTCRSCERGGGSLIHSLCAPVLASSRLYLLLNPLALLLLLAWWLLPYLACVLRECWQVPCKLSAVQQCSLFLRSALCGLVHHLHSAAAGQGTGDLCLHICMYVGCLHALGVHLYAGSTEQGALFWLLSV